MQKLETIHTLLNEVHAEYNERYAWGDEEHECRSLFFKIRSEIEEKIRAEANTKKSISLDEVLRIVENFSNTWKNKPTDCDDTDGRIHIGSIYSKLADALVDEDETEDKPSSFYSKRFLIFYSLFIIFLFLLFLCFVDSL